MQLMDANSQRNPIPSGYVKIAIENDPVEIVDFPINSMVIFNSKLLNYQRVDSNLLTGYQFRKLEYIP